MTRHRPTVRPFVSVSVLALALTAPARGDGPAENLVVVTLDGFRWQEVFTGADESFVDAKLGGVRDADGLR